MYGVADGSKENHYRSIESALAAPAQSNKDMIHAGIIAIEKGRGQLDHRYVRMMCNAHNSFCYD